jgi:TolA-binding protein
LWIVGFALLLSWGACSGPSAEQQLDAALQVARSAARDSTQAAEAVGLLDDFLVAHPRHASVPEALKQLAILRQQVGDMDAAVAAYERILGEFPTSDVADEAQFMVAFINEEHRRDFEAARAAYQAVIDNYPDSELAANARQLLPYVGRPPEEWVRFQEGDSTTSP